MTHTWERTQTFTPSSGVGINVTTGGISVTGTSALAAVTCTTVTASGAISGTTGTFSSTLQGGQTVQAVAGTVTSRLSADSGNGWGTLGTYSNHPFKFVSNSITRGELTAAGVFELDRITAQSVTVSGGTTAVAAFTASTGSFSSTLAVTGAATFANNVTISGTMLIAGGSGSASTIIRNATTGLTLQGYAGSSYDMVLADAAGTNRWALTSSGTILANAAMTVTSTVTLPATGATYALDFTGAAGRLRLSNNGSLTVVENDGSTAIMTITESTGGVAFAGKVTTRASSTATSGLNLPHGSAPTSPANGDVWTTTAGVFVRVNGTTVGPLLDSTSGGVTGSGTSGTLTKWTGSGAVGNSIITESGTTVTVANTLAATTVQTGTTSISNSGLFVGGQKVVGAQRTGWTAATGTDTRSTFATGSVTTAQLAERVKALIDDLLAHGLLTA